MSTVKEFFACMFKKSRARYKAELSKQTGLILDEDIKNRDNHRIAGLLSRSAAVYIITVGTVTAFMSIFNIPCNMLLIFGALSAVSVFLTLVQLSPLMRLAGYGVCLYGLWQVFSQTPGLLRSGIYAVTNICYELVRVKYKLPAVDGFDEIITDRSLTIPVFVVAGSIVFMMILWEISGRVINLTLTAVIPFVAISTGLFFGGVPNDTSVIYLCIGWLFFACVKFCGKHTFVFAEKKQFNIFIHKKRHYYHKQLNGKAALQFLGLVFVMSALFPPLLGRALDSNAFEGLVPQSQLKEFSDFMVKDAMILAFSKYKNYTVRGSVSPGQIGQYSSVHPDHKPDLEITYVPATLSREYLRYFTGTEYSSDGWTAANGFTDAGAANMTAAAAKKQGQPFKKIAVKSLDVVSNTALLPYHTDLDSNSYITPVDDNHINLDILPGVRYEATYYDTPAEPFDDGEYRTYVRQNYTAVPEENRALIENLCLREGFAADDPELDQKLAAYFQNNFTYTLDPGLVPWQTDFVNYFLFETKQGLCAHFASAGTLIYRTLGIPARYAEGYVIDYPIERREQTVLEDEQLSDWYGGKTPFSEHPVKITLSDFKAHAWVEIYRDGFGWVPVELTPVDFDHDYEEKDSDLAVAEKLADLMLLSRDNSEPKEIDTEYYKKRFDEILGYIGFAAVLVLVLCIFGIVLKTLLRHGIRLYRFSKRDERSVIELYAYAASILAYLGKIENTSFKAADKALSQYIRSPELVSDIVQQILYSPTPADASECENACISLHTALEKIFAQCSLSQKIKIVFKI